VDSGTVAEAIHPDHGDAGGEPGKRFTEINVCPRATLRIHRCPKTLTAFPTHMLRLNRLINTKWRSRISGFEIRYLGFRNCRRDCKQVVSE